MLPIELPVVLPVVLLVVLPGVLPVFRTAEIVGSGSLSNTRDERLGDVGLIVLDEVGAGLRGFGLSQAKQRLELGGLMV